MGKRLGQQQKERIRKDERSVRVLAKEYGTSSATIQRVKKTNSVFDPSWEKTTRPEIGGFEEIFFFEMLRLSRYHHGKLMRYLAPISTWLPSQAPLIGRSKASHNREPVETTDNQIISSTIWRRMKRYASGELCSAHDEKDAEPGTIAIHKIRILWSTDDDEQHKSEILLIMDRAMGLLFARAYKRIRHGEVERCMSWFEKMYGTNIPSMHFVMALDPASKASRSTALHYPRLGDSSSLTASSRDDLIGEREASFQVHADEDTPGQVNRALISGTFKNLKEINRALSRLINKIHFTPREYSDKKVRGRELSLIGKMQEHYQLARGELIFADAMCKKIKLPL